MRTYTLAISITAIALLLIPEETLAHNDEGSATTVVNMTSAGYNPEDLSIDQGTTVIFENVGSEALWPASNIHPTHEIYSEFDPKQPILPGETWKFTFTRAGTWRYHDHLFPHLTGTITVVGSNADTTRYSIGLARVVDYIASLLRTLFSSPVKNTQEAGNNAWKATQHPYDPAITAEATEVFHDYDKLYSYVKKFGPAATMQHLHTLSASFGSCHDAAHRAGRFAYEIYGNEAFQKCSAECHSGCYHGATEQFFKLNGTDTLNDNLDTICSFSANPFFSHQCVHGIGHGLMAWASYEIVDALHACDLLEIPLSRESCYTGAFMENIVGTLGQGEEEGHYTKYLNEDPHYPCSVVDEQYKASCYFLQTSRMMQLFSGNFEEIARACSEAPQRYQSHCFSSMGRDVGGVHRNEPANAIAACAAAPAGSNRTDCLVGAAQDTFWDPSGQDAALAFCKLLGNTDEKDACYRTIVERAPQVLASPQEQQRFCDTVEAAYRMACRSSMPVIQ